MRIALYPGEMIDVAEWLSEQARDAGFEVVIRTDEEELGPDDQAVLILGEEVPRVDGLLRRAEEAQARGLPIIWAVDGVPFSGAFREFSDFAALEDAAPLLEAILSLPREEEEKPKRRLTLPKVLKRAGETPEEAGALEEPPRRQTPTAAPLSNVIAVGGPGGTGASFIAWNLAEALGAVLVEGRTTGVLAAWLGVEEPDTRGRLLSGENIRHAVTADRPLSEDDIDRLGRLPGLVVVDVGHSLDSPIWQRAGKRVFVVTPDPRFQGMRIPDDASRVMNRFPRAFPSRPEKLLGARVDLVVPDLGREAFLSIWARRAWILDRPDEMERWRRLFAEPFKQER